MKPKSNSLINNFLCVLSFAVVGLISLASADVVVTQFVSFSDGNDGGALNALVGFDVVNTNSILIATIYVDTTTPGPLISNVRFGDGGGIGSGDIAPTLTFSDSRLLSYVFINPDTSPGLFFRADNSDTNGIAAALYEVSGANTALSSITTATNSTTISTTTASELVVSFAGRNGAPGTRYKLVEADDLDFTTPDQDPIPLTGATVGTLDVNEVMADASGDATIQFNLGISKTSTFLRAVTVP